MGLAPVVVAIDASVHIQLAASYQMAFPVGIGGGNQFRIQPAANDPRRPLGTAFWEQTSNLIAAVVALSAFAVVVLSVYGQFAGALFAVAGFMMGVSRESDRAVPVH